MTYALGTGQFHHGSLVSPFRHDIDTYRGVGLLTVGPAGEVIQRDCPPGCCTHTDSERTVKEVASIVKAGLLKRVSLRDATYAFTEAHSVIELHYALDDVSIDDVLMVVAAHERP